MPKKSGGGKAWTYSRMSLTSPGADQRNKIIRPPPTSEAEQQQQIIAMSNILASEARISPVLSNIQTPETRISHAVSNMSKIQTSEIKTSPVLSNQNQNNSCPNTPQSVTPIDLNTPPVDNFRSPSSQAIRHDDFLSAPQQTRLNNFLSAPQQTRLNNFRSSPPHQQRSPGVNGFWGSPQVGNDTTSRNFHPTGPCSRAECSPTRPPFINDTPSRNFHPTRSNQCSIAGYSPTRPTYPPRHLDLKLKNAPSPEISRRDFHHYAEVNLRANNFLSPEAPRDKGGKIYAAFVLGGVGYMLPFTCFVVAVDYYQSRYPGSTIIFDLTLATILAGTLGVLFNNLTLEALSLTSRVTLGYVTSTTLLLLLTTCDLGLSMFTARDGYWITIGCAALVAVGCSMQQSSYYGYANMLPRRFTQAVMLGESFAGTLVSTNRIATKLVLEDVRLNTIIFFVISALLVVACWATFLSTRKSSFVQFHLLTCARSRGRYSASSFPEGGAEHGVYEFDVLEDDLEPRPSYGVLSDSRTRIGLGLETSSSSGVMVTTAADYPLRTEFVGLRQADDMTSLVNHTSRSSLCSDRFHARWEVVKLIYPYMVSFGLVFFVTASLYPGIISEMSSCRLGSWMPVVLMACFNLMDALGKVLMPVKKDLTRRRLVCSAIVRFSLIPLALMCVMPRLQPILSGEVWPILLTMVLGFSNGYYGCLPLVLAPSRVAPRFRELCGNTMMLAFAFAIVCGAFTSYGLGLLLGPHQEAEVCSSLAENSSSLISHHIGVPSIPAT